MRAKELNIEKWLNTAANFEVNLFDGTIKYIHFFQMLCPGCVYYGIPQTIEIFQKFESKKLKVMAVHSVFEHHEVMNEDALNVFIHEWKLPFAVGIDRRKEGEWMPETMKAYQMQGTPTTIVIDGKGEIRLAHFGHIEQEQLEAFLNRLLNE
jgi:thiol-disulfide isomerase/thioredoxin